MYAIVLKSNLYILGFHSLAVCLPILLSSSLMATLSSISLLFISLFALVVALALSRPAFPYVASIGGDGFFSVLDARGGVTIAGGSFSGLFAPFDGGDIPLIDKSGDDFSSVGFIADDLVLWPTTSGGGGYGILRWIWDPTSLGSWVHVFYWSFAVLVGFALVAFLSWVSDLFSC